MATHHLPAHNSAVDTSRYERVGARLVERPLPSKDHARIQFAVTTLLRAKAKTLRYDVLQEWTLEEHDQPAHNWMTPDVLVAESPSPVLPLAICFPRPSWQSKFFLPSKPLQRCILRRSVISRGE